MKRRKVYVVDFRQVSAFVTTWADVDRFAETLADRAYQARRQAQQDTAQHWVTFAKFGYAYRWRAQLRPDGAADYVRFETQYASGSKWAGPQAPSSTLVPALQVALTAWREAGGPKGRPTKLKAMPSR